VAQANIVHQLDRRAVRALLASPRGGLAKDLMRRGLRVESAAKRNLTIGPPKRVDTGRLRSSITTALITVGGYPAVVVGTNVKYAAYVHDGTGLYGPRKRLIRPISAKALRWETKRPRPGGRRQSTVVYARYSRGMPPNPFLRNALSAART
jgi:hypothetical protein